MDLRAALAWAGMVALSGCDAELDRLRALRNTAELHLAELEALEVSAQDPRTASADPSARLTDRGSGVLSASVAAVLSAVEGIRGEIDLALEPPRSADVGLLVEEPLTIEIDADVATIAAALERLERLATPWRFDSLTATSGAVRLRLVGFGFVQAAAEATTPAGVLDPGPDEGTWRSGSRDAERAAIRRLLTRTAELEERLVSQGIDQSAQARWHRRELRSGLLRVLEARIDGERRDRQLIFGALKDAARMPRMLRFTTRRGRRACLLELDREDDRIALWAALEARGAAVDQSQRELVLPSGRGCVVRVGPAG